MGQYTQLITNAPRAPLCDAANLGDPTACSAPEVYTMTATDNMNSVSDQAASNQAAKIWIGIAVGAAVGIGIALSRRKKTRWESAKEISTRLADRSGDFADVTRGIV